MTYDSFRHHRRSIRIKGYDYSSEGAYFVTICTRFREGILNFAPIREIVQASWSYLTDRFSNLRLDEFVIMPNHVHGIIWIDGPVGAGFSCPNLTHIGATGLPQEEGARTAPLRRMTLGNVMAYFKHQSTKAVNSYWGDPNPAIPVWQRNYYERIIRNDDELNQTRQYIIDNPKNWDKDPENI